MRNFGHRVADISFKNYDVTCDCGVVIKPDETGIPGIDHEQMAVKFSRHRKEEMIKLGINPNP